METPNSLRSNGQTTSSAETITLVADFKKKINRPSWKTEYEIMAVKAGKYFTFGIIGWIGFIGSIIYQIIINFS
jgi:preprotein translocase subunit Sss1